MTSMSDRREALLVLYAAAELHPGGSLFDGLSDLAPSSGPRPTSGILGGILNAFKPLIGGRSAASDAVRTFRESEFARAQQAVASAAAVADQLEAARSWVDARVAPSTLASREARTVLFESAPRLVQRHRLDGLASHERLRLRAALLRDGDVGRVLEEMLVEDAQEVARVLESLGRLRAVIEFAESAAAAMEDETFKKMVAADPRLHAALRVRIVAARRLERGGRFDAAAKSWSQLAEWARSTTTTRSRLRREASDLQLELEGLRKAVANDETKRWSNALKEQLLTQEGEPVRASNGEAILAASIAGARITLVRALVEHAARSHWTEVRKSVASSARLLSAVASATKREVPELASVKLTPKRSVAMAHTDELFRFLSGIVETHFSNVRDGATREHQRAIDSLPDGGTYVFPFGEHRGPFVIRRTVTIDGSGSHFWSRRGPVFSVTEGHLSLRNLTLEREDRGLRVFASRKATWSMDVGAT